MSLFQDLLRRHRELKHKIHNTRIPLGKRGRMIMTCVYFFTPMAFGLVLFDYTNKSRNAKWGLDSEGRMLGSEQTSRVMNDQAKLSESKARLEQVFADSNVSRPSQE